MGDKPSRKQMDRPGFSLPTMSTNFRRFNARIGVVFVFQNQLIQLFNWRKPSHTMSFLAIYTFTCLDPSVISILPLALTLYFVMVPSFLARHPPPPSLSLTNLYPLTGPPLAPPSRIKPAPELSKDFFRNMRDLQNCMEDFSILHDAIIANVAPLTNFSSEPVSSTLFIALFVSCIILFLTAHLLPWRALALVSGWSAILAGHPTIQALLDTPENQSFLSSEVKTNHSRFNTFADSDISLDPAPEQREVEIFELHYRPLHADPGDEWEPMMFTPVPYTPLSPARISGDRPKGTRFFEDVQPPKGWSYVDKKWSLDLLAKEWIEERCITGVEAELEGARWVIDIIKDEDEEDEGGMEMSKSNEWRYGEWRRRRWVRVVERVRIERKDGES